MHGNLHGILNVNENILQKIKSEVMQIQSACANYYLLMTYYNKNNQLYIPVTAI